MITISFSLYKFVFILFLWLCSTIAFRMWLGNKRDMHFKRTQAKLFLSRKTPLADYFSIGTPKDLYGLKLYIILFAVLSLEFIAVLCL